jgi:hypothetical protein
VATLGWHVNGSRSTLGVAFDTAECSDVAAGATSRKDTAPAITLSSGLKISSVIGIDLSTQTGFNTSTGITHVYSSAGQLCGSDHNWSDAARIVGK